MVSVDPTGPYETSLVRLVSGDGGPDGPGLRVQPVESLLTGHHPGVARRCHPGSYGLIESFPALAGEATFSLYFKPTLLVADHDEALMDLAAGALRLVVSARGLGVEGSAVPALDRAPVTPHAWHWLLLRMEVETLRLLIRRLA